MRTQLFKTLARVFGARKAKKLISELAFSAPEYSHVNQNCPVPRHAFCAEEELKGGWFWVEVERKWYRRNYKPCQICGDDASVSCRICDIPF